MMRILYDEWMLTWKNEMILNAGYEKYLQLANRLKPFSSNNIEDIKNMYVDKKKLKK